MWRILQVIIVIQLRVQQLLLTIGNYYNPVDFTGLLAALYHYCYDDLQQIARQRSVMV